MNTVQDRAQELIRHWVENHPQAALYDEASGTILDVASGKSVRPAWRELTDFEEKIHPETKENYLAFLFEDGTQIALVDPGGVAFAPLTDNSGPVENLPPVVCLRDFLTLKQRIDHYLYQHADKAPPRESLDLIMVCIATLDGARAVGFDIGDFEAELEKSLDELERRKVMT